MSGGDRRAEPPPTRARTRSGPVRLVLAFVLLGLLGIQLIPVERSNPPVSGEIVAPQHVMAVLRRACYDCHSNETRWRWYGRVAPLSWLVSRDVRKGREHLNFSVWTGYGPEARQEKLEEIWEEVERGKMPTRIYMALHPRARLSAEDRSLLGTWTHEVPDWVRSSPD